MKKLFMFLAVAAFAASCGNDLYYEPEDGLRTTSYYITVKSGEWVWDNVKGEYYFGLDNVAELTPSVIESGLYQMYWVWTDDFGDDVYEPMPATEYNTNAAGDLWERSIACDYSAYKIVFYVRDSQFFDERPGTMNFRFVVLR